MFPYVYKASDEGLYTHSSFCQGGGGRDTQGLQQGEGKLVKYIEGKAKFVSRYEVAFFFFLGKTLTKTKSKIQK